MATNIYLELELFLDPPITDAGALQADINGKISHWNKMVNADAKFKRRVETAKKYLAQGLSNLQSLANTARNEKLQALRSDIKKAGRVGGINEIKLKKLKTTYRTFFSESTIEKECGGTMPPAEGPAAKPLFVPPKPIDSLSSPKKVLFAEMERLADDLEHIDGQPKNLYELLKALRSDNRETLYSKAKNLSANALKMPKHNEQADPLNRLAGKCINFFKDDQNRKNYDIAWKRYPFDYLCKDEFEYYIDKENGVPWDVYQESIQKTVQQGFTRGEAEWLVYEYYCVVHKCPDPIPETDKPVLPQQVTGPAIDYVGIAAKKAGQFWKQCSKQAKDWYHKAKEALPAAGQSESPKPDTLQKTIEKLRRKHGQQTEPALHYLNGLFNELNSLLTRHSAAPAEMVQEVQSFRAEIAEVLGDIKYTDGCYVPALQCYQAVLDYMPHHVKAGSRFRMIQNIKDSLFQQIRAALTEKNYLACKHNLGELKTKFAGDAESEDFVRNTEKQIQNVPVSAEHIQRLIQENQWYAVMLLLEQNSQAAHVDVLLQAKKRLDNVEKNIPALRRTLHSGNFKLAQQQLAQIKGYVADYPEYESLVNESKQFREYLHGLNSEFKELIDAHQLIKAENKLRRFLTEHPKYWQGLAGYARLFADGVTRFQNGVRFGLFTVLGGIVFIIVSVALCQAVQTGFGSKGVVLSIGLGFLMTGFAYAMMIRFFYTMTATPFIPGGFRLIAAGVLLVLASFTGCFAFVPGMVKTVLLNVVHADPFSAATENKMLIVLVHGVVCFAFFYIVHVYLFSFFNLCMEDEKEQPLLSPVFGNVIFTVLLLLAKPDSTITSSFFLGLIALLWWVLVSLTAYLHLHKDMNTFSLSGITDYLQRHALLHQYKDTDFDKPLLYTDWYQKALNLAQQQTASRTK